MSLVNTVLTKDPVLLLTALFKFYNRYMNLVVRLFYLSEANNLQLTLKTSTFPRRPRELQNVLQEHINSGFGTYCHTETEVADQTCSVTR